MPSAGMVAALPSWSGCVAPLHQYSWKRVPVQVLTLVLGTTHYLFCGARAGNTKDHDADAVHDSTLQLRQRMWGCLRLLPAAAGGARRNRVDWWLRPPPNSDRLHLPHRYR